MEMRIKIYMGTHTCLDMCEKHRHNKTEQKQTKTTADMVSCMSALPRGMNISKSINRYSFSA
jgi:hypothetical protein